MNIKSWFHLPAITAGFVSVLVGYSSSSVIIFQAAQSANATPAEVASWIMVLGLGMGISSIGLSLRYKAPVLTAWSTPGAALLVTSLEGIPMSEAIGAFLFSAVLITLCGATGWFEKVMNRIPVAIGAAMLTGVLFRFGLDIFVSMQSEFILVAMMFGVYLVSKRFSARYAVIAVLIAGFFYCWFGNMLDFSGFAFAISAPVFTMPSFAFSSLISIGIPLFVVTMVSQNIPGITVLRTAGYSTPISPLISWTGITTLIIAPFGGFALNLAAITAAICAGPEAHHDHNRRYLASVSAGIFYLILGLGGATVAALFAVFPTEYILALAGLALLTTIANSLHLAMADTSSREAATITFLVTASGITLFGIGSAFWGLIAGVLALLCLNQKT